MKANTDKHLENFTRKLMKENSLDKPSVDFTAHVMSKVWATNTAFVYKPLISKPAWVIIFVGIFSLTGYLLFNTAEASSGSWFQNMDLSKISFLHFNYLAGSKISTVTLYTVVMATIMLFIQISLLKNYFSKRVKT